MRVVKWVTHLLILLLTLLVTAIALVCSDWFRNIAEDEFSDIVGRSVTITGDIEIDLFLSPRFRIKNMQLENAPWAESKHMASVQVLEFSLDLPELLTGEVVITNLMVLEPSISLLVSEQGKKNWVFDTDNQPAQEATSENDKKTAIPTVKQVTIDNGRITYANRANDPKLSAVMTNLKIEGSQQQPLRISADGEIQGFSTNVNLSGATLRELYDPNGAFPVKGQVLAGKSELKVEGSLKQAGMLAGLDLYISLTSPDAGIIDALLGEGMADLPGYKLQTQVIHTDQTWHLRNLYAQFGNSEIAGHLKARVAAPDRFLQAGLAADTLDVSQLEEIYHSLGVGSEKTGSSELPSLLVPENSDSADRAPEGEEQESAISESMKDMLEQLKPWTADIDLQASKIITSEFSISEFSLQLHLAEDGQLTIDPLSLAVNGGDASGNLSLDLGQWPLNGFVSGQFNALDLAWLATAYGADEELPGTLSGDVDLQFHDTGVGRENAKFMLPFLGQLTINPSEIIYKDSTRNTLVKTTIASEHLDSGQQIVRVDGSGRYTGEPFEVDLKGDSLLNLRNTDKPYSFDLAMTAADTRMQLDGWIKNIFALTGMNVSLSVEGPNPARLYPLLGIALPELPPYQFSGDLTYQQNASWQISNISGNVGDSDIQGEINLDLAEEQPLLSADLYSNSLDFDDLAGLVGAAPDAGPGETASPKQQREAEQEAQSQTVLPNDPINLQRLRDINASVDFKGKRVQVDKLPLDSLTLELDLEDGHMKIDPLTFAIGHGTVSSNIELKAGAKPIQGILATEIRHVDLNEVMEPFDIGQDSAGTIGGRAKYWMRGNSVAELLASADGGLYMLMTEGQLDGLLIEVAGFDWGEAMAAFFANQRNVDIRCAYLNLHTRGGSTAIKNAIIDTDDTVFAATGSLDLGMETVNIVLEPHPKDLSLFSTRAPLRIEGTFKDPVIAPGSAALASKAAFAVLMTAAAGPIGTMLPFVEPGLTNDSNFCNGLIDSVNSYQ